MVREEEYSDYLDEELIQYGEAGVGKLAYKAGSGVHYLMEDMMSRYGNHASELRRIMKDASRRYAMFTQSEVWVNATGTYVQIKDISARYADNILAHMRDHAREDMELYMLWSSRDAQAASDNFDPTEEGVDAWLRNTPLYMALEAASERPF